MAKPWKEPKLEDLLSDPILDILLAYDRLSRDDLDRAIERGRQALARAPRPWETEAPPREFPVRRLREAEAGHLASFCL
jgi:hypothetical protein